ncbi:unnamed protein product [Sphagnum jensenii]|uniref:Uncharacterized protein n=1 Tax=Sphagnum jensenii TaxID=128206 RepID=A0ABP1B8X0_9BRYO
MAMASSSVSLLRFSPLSASSVSSSPFRRITISRSPSSSNRRRRLLFSKDLVLEGGSGGGQENGNGGSGGGGGGGSGKGGQGEERSDFIKKMSLSQKLTLAYAALVGVGGVIGFFKTGSNKSLLAGGGSALVLYYVYLTLPHNPFLASAIGLGISSLLLIVMGSRFKNSGKVFPAGVVSLFSLIMTGGYLHGMLRKSHA